MSLLQRHGSLAPSIAPAESDAPGAAGRMLILPFDPWLALAAIGLGICSLLTLQNAGGGEAGSAAYYVQRQAVYLGLGIVAMLAISRLDYAPLRNFARPLYGFLLLSLLAVRVIGSSANGSVRAIQLPLFSYQASEVGKVLLVVVLSGLFVERIRQVREARSSAQLLLVALVAALLVMLQPDLGSSLVYLVAALAVLFLGGVPGRHLAVVLAAGATLSAIVLFAAPAAGVHVLKHYQEERLTSFLHPSSKGEGGYQQLQSKIAIGSGQKTGASSSGRVDINYVPEAQTDFIFASLGERFGFVGAALVLSLFALLIWRILRTVTLAKDLFGSLLAGGVVAMVMFQVFINVGMAIGISPITGITLPLMSYGGSSILSTMIGLGLVQSVYAQARNTQSRKSRSPVLA